MKNKVLIISLLVIISCILGYFVFDLKSKNSDLSKEYDEMLDIVKQNELDKETYDQKEQKLEELKEKNKDKISKYEEVEKWNQEIKSYLD